MASMQTNLKQKNVLDSNESSDDVEEKPEVTFDLSLEKLSLGPEGRGAAVVPRWPC